MLGIFVDSDRLHAAHLVLYKHGPDVMDAMFGRENPDISEMFSSLNGLLIDLGIEAKLDSGDIIIVPNFPDLASKS